MHNFKDKIHFYESSMLFLHAEEARATIYHSQCAYMLSIQTKAVKNNNNKKPSLALYVIIMTFKAP